MAVIQQFLSDVFIPLTCLGTLFRYQTDVVNKQIQTDVSSIVLV